MVAPGDIGSFSSSLLFYPANLNIDALSDDQIAEIETMAADVIWGCQADGVPRQDSPRQRAEREEAIEAEEHNQPFPLDRKKCDKHGEIRVSHRCIALKRDGEQCGARTAMGSRCWNHTARDLHLRIKRSGIPGAGKGLWWTGANLGRNARVTKYTGDISMDPEQEHGGSKYVVGLSKSVTLAAGRMINDPRGSGFKANTKFAIDNRNRTVRIVTTRPVKKNTEFFLPYGPAYWTRFNKIKAEQAAKQKAKLKVKRRAKKALAAAASSASSASQRSFEPDPLTHDQAMRTHDAAQWKEAERAEQKSLEDMNVYEFVFTIPADARILDSKPVYRRKRKHDGSVARHKMRLVARGFMQREGKDYDEVFSPVAMYSSIRMMLAVAAAKDLELEAMDVETAYLHAPLNRSLYMKIPAGFVNVPKGAVAILLKKSMYGLKQAGLLWNRMLTQALADAGFEAGVNGDMCTFTKHTHSDRLIVLAIFVDDILYMYDKRDAADVKQFKLELASKFKIKDLGPATSMLGMRITRDREERTLELDQEQYIRQCCDALELSDSKPMLTPENTAASARRSDRSTAVVESSSSSPAGCGNISISSYRSAVGMLGYTALATRPDAAHAYTMAARQQQAPTHADIIAIARTFSYLLASASLSLRYSADSDSEHLTAFSDADWAGDSSDARSTSGSVLKLSGAAVVWESKKQSNVALSSSEAEYIAASETARSIKWARVYLAEIGEAQAAPTPLRIDNETAIRMALEDGNQGRRKHINVKHHFIREQARDSFISLEWVPTTEQQADILTKITTRKQFFAMRDLVMGHAHSVN